MTGESSRRVVVVGASAGGVEALKALVGGLPSRLPVPVLVVLHMPSDGTSVLARILDRAGPLPAREAEHGASLRPGTVTVAKPGHHLLVRDGRVALGAGPTESHYRPSVNALFRSAALDAGPGAIGVVLSGALGDGAAGLADIVARRGTAIVQDLEEAIFRSMPENALIRVPAAEVLPAAGVGTRLDKLITEDIREVMVEPDPMLELANKIALGRADLTDGEKSRLSGSAEYICPDCGGPMVEVGTAEYRCRVGHGWTSEALLQEQDDEVERALWTAVRALEDRARLANRTASQLGGSVGDMMSAQLRQTIDEAQQAAEVVRRYLLAHLRNGRETAEEQPGRR